MTLPRFCSALLLVALALPAFAADPNPATLHSDGGAWPLYRQWTPAETQHFGRWVENLYHVKRTGTREQRLAKLEATLTDPEMNLLLRPAFAGSPSNPQLDAETIRKIHPVLDCGKLTVMLTAYYAYRRGLPWMVTAIRSGDGTDIRYSSHNVPLPGRSCRDYSSPHTLFVDAIYGFCTGNYRINPDDGAAQFSDTVPVAIRPDTLLPGALYYLDGHVLMLGQIDSHGGLRFLDATVSPTRDIYTFNGLNAVSGLTPSRSVAPRYAGCYRGFRIFRYPIAETDAMGKVLRVRRRTDAEMAAFGYSLDQYDRLRELMDTGRIRVGDGTVDSFHDYVRLRMGAGTPMDPLAYLEDFADDFVHKLNAREQFVQAGWKHVRASGPIVFPEGNRDANIFSAGGEWGRFATADADARLRADYFQMVDTLTHIVNSYRRVPDRVHLNLPENRRPYDEPSLALYLRAEKARIFGSHAMTYRDEAGRPVRLSLLDIEERLYDLSFDPNHPPSVRWGASPKGNAGPGTPLPDGTRVSPSESYRREAYYRAMTYREVIESRLRTNLAAGFPKRDLLDVHLARRWQPGPPPPLVPRGFKLAKR